MGARRVAAPASRRFDPTDPSGFVVRDTVTYHTGQTHVSYWYGPDHGYANTWGGLDGSVAVWPSRSAAELALSYAGKREDHRHKIVAVTAAVEAEVAHVEAYAVRRVGYLRGES